RGLTRRRVPELAGANTVAHRPARDVFVGDVDVPVVAGVGVGPQTPWMAQPRGRFRLALRAPPGLALARDDLQRDVEAVRLVARKPNGARAAAPQRPQGAVAAKDELTGRKGRDRCRHVRSG